MLRKLQSVLQQAKEKGVLDTTLYVATRFIGILKNRTLLPPNTVEENLRQWSKWDWSTRGEEWTPSQHWKESLVRHVLEPNIPMGSRVLEVGPGGGRWTDFLVKRAAHVTAVDLTPKCIEVCRERFKGRENVSFVVNDGTDLSFIPTASIDRVWSFDVFVHIQSKGVKDYMRQLSQILAPGGRGVIHHAARGTQRKGWRSDMTAQDMIDFCNEYGLIVVNQFSSWDGGRVGIDPTSPDNGADVITLFEKPLP